MRILTTIVTLTTHPEIPPFSVSHQLQRTTYVYIHITLLIIQLLQ